LFIQVEPYLELLKSCL